MDSPMDGTTRSCVLYKGHMTALYHQALDGMLTHSWVTPSSISPAPLKKRGDGLKIRVKGNEERASTRIHDLPEDHE